MERGRKSWKMSGRKDPPLGPQRGGPSEEDLQMRKGSYREELEKHIRRLRIAQRKERPIPRSYPSLMQLRQQKEEEELEDTPLSTTLKPSLKMVPSAPLLPPASFAEPPLYHVQPCRRTCDCNQGLERGGWREWLGEQGSATFPVFEDSNTQQRYHQALD